MNRILIEFEISIRKKIICQPFCFQPESWSTLRNELIAYVMELRTSGQLNSALARLIMFSTGISSQSNEQGTFIIMIASSPYVAEIILTWDG